MQKETPSMHVILQAKLENVKSASRSKNLGNLQFHMRKAQRILRAVRNSAEASAYAADNAHYSCSHDMDHASLDR